MKHKAAVEKQEKGRLGEEKHTSIDWAICDAQPRPCACNSIYTEISVNLLGCAVLCSITQHYAASHSKHRTAL